VSHFKSVGHVASSYENYFPKIEAICYFPNGVVFYKSSSLGTLGMEKIFYK